jgi:hypothetical protein
MAARQLLVQRLLLSEEERRQSIDVLKAVDWPKIPSLLRTLGREINQRDVETIARTDIDDIRSCMATRQAFAAIGDRSRGIVPGLCAEIVGWFGARLSLSDVAAQYAEQRYKSGQWSWK